jgi:hypothetical protein
MENFPRLLTFLLLAVSLSLNLEAQETISAAGGNAVESAGSVSFTIGQTFYTAPNGAGGSILQGVQQPYEISIVTGIEQARGIELSVAVFPNPVTDFLVLRVDQYDPEWLYYQLFDVQGRLIKTGKILGEETLIDMEGTSPSVYLLRILDNETYIKTFRIIKK